MSKSVKYASIELSLKQMEIQIFISKIEGSKCQVQKLRRVRKFKLKVYKNSPLIRQGMNIYYQAVVYIVEEQKLRVVM